MPLVSSLKRPSELLYSFLITLLLVALTLVGAFDSVRFQDYYGVVELLALGVGCLHLWLGSRFAPTLLASMGQGVVVALLMLLVAMGIAFVVYGQTGSLAERWPFITSLVPFMVPSLLAMTYQYFLQIPPATYRQWYYPVDGPMPDVDLLDLSKILVIQFEFLKTPDDANLTNFKAKAPIAMSLGDLFLIFINDYNERNPANPIEYASAAGEIYGWTFTKKRAWWQRPIYLDPDLDFTQNRIVDNDTLFARREK